MKRFRIFLYIFLFIFVLFCAYFYFSPLGYIKHHHSFNQKNKIGKGLVYKLGPSDRIISENKIFADPVYFYLRSFRKLHKAKLKIKYKISPELLSSKEFIDISFGVLLDKDNWNYKLYPLYNNILNNLDDSGLQKFDDFIFWQAEGGSLNYSEFLKSEDFYSTYFYNFNPDFNFILKEYQNNEEYLLLERIRSSYSFFNYIKDGDLKLDFLFSKLDPLKSQNISIFIYLKDELIFSESISDKVFSDNSDFNYSLLLKDLPEATYKIEIKSDDNLISEKIRSNSAKLVFINKVYLDNAKKGIDLFANGSDFSIKVVNSGCLNIFYIEDEQQNINKIYQQFKFDLNKSNNKVSNIKSNSCGALIEGDSLFSFSQESFFNPLPKKFNKNTKINELKYLFANYKKAENHDDIFISELEVDLSSALKEDNAYRFLISAPFLDSINKDNYIELISIDFDLYSNSIFNKINRLIK